ncbi:hypothetical protein [Paenibacillus xylanexedens]|uniref:hypothetical protein n=1 Tax=Paenibacillus xylanexedens TaxID=528191 RepID=UPI0011A482EA|nr:hypothetical protein [Paenibacillus xylanexedens]
MNGTTVERIALIRVFSTTKITETTRVVEVGQVVWHHTPITPELSQAAIQRINKISKMILEPLVAVISHAQVHHELG